MDICEHPGANLWDLGLRVGDGGRGHWCGERVCRGGGEGAPDATLVLFDRELN